MIWNNNEIEVKNTHRKKTINIIIERDGKISALVPENFDNNKLTDILNKKEYEITKHLLLWKQTHENKIVRRFISGQSFMYLGRNYILKLVDDDKIEQVILKNGMFILNKNTKNPIIKFVDFYKKQAKTKILERVNKYQPYFKEKSSKVGIRTMKTRWGSCTSTKKIFFNWKCIMAPLNVIDYIVVHELAHLEHANHTREFWNKVSNILPNYQESKQWLKVNGIKMDI